MSNSATKPAATETLFSRTDGEFDPIDPARIDAYVADHLMGMGTVFDAQGRAYRLKVKEVEYVREPHYDVEAWELARKLDLRSPEDVNLGTPVQITESLYLDDDEAGAKAWAEEAEAQLTALGIEADWDNDDGRLWLMYTTTVGTALGMERLMTGDIIDGLDMGSGEVREALEARLEHLRGIRTEAQGAVSPG